MRLHIICGALLLAYVRMHKNRRRRRRRQADDGQAQAAAAAAVDGRVADRAARRRQVDAGGEARRHLPPGAEVALIGADPMSTGLDRVLRTKAGYKLPAHCAHAHSRLTTCSRAREPGRSTARRSPSTAGTFVVVQLEAVKHEFACDAGAPCVFLLRRVGPDRLHLGRQVVS